MTNGSNLKKSWHCNNLWVGERSFHPPRDCWFEFSQGMIVLSFKKCCICNVIYWIEDGVIFEDGDDIHHDITINEYDFMELLWNSDNNLDIE